MGPSHAILEATHFRPHLVDLLMVEDGFKKAIGGRRPVRGALLRDGRLVVAMNWAGI